AMMSRRGDAWITNVSQGGVPEPVDAAERGLLERLAVAATKAVGARFSGVDLVKAEDGTVFVLEVNSMPAWSGLQTVSETNIEDVSAAGMIAYLAMRVEAARTPRLARPA